MAKSGRALAAGMTMALVMLVAQHRPLQALGPTVIMFYGATLKQPVFVTGTDTAAFGDLQQMSPVTGKDLDQRPYLSVAFFWGPASDPALNGTRALADLTPKMAWQHGRFYPATATQPAMLLVTQLTKSTQPVPAPGNPDAAQFRTGGPVPAAALAVLQRAGISTGPTR